MSSNVTTHKIYVSHSLDNKEYGLLMKSLNSRGDALKFVDVSKESNVGSAERQDKGKLLEKAIKEANYLVVFAGNNSNLNSEYVEAEIDLAKQHCKPVLAYVTDITDIGHPFRDDGSVVNYYDVESLIDKLIQVDVKKVQ